LLYLGYHYFSVVGMSLSLGLKNLIHFLTFQQVEMCLEHREFDGNWPKPRYLWAI